jgi:predicted ferric reductase
MVAVWKHPHPARVQSRLYVIIAAAAYVSLTVIQLASVVFRNVLLSRRCARAYVEPYGTASRITLNLDRPFKVKPGQWTYVWIPSVSFWSPFHSHPFMVSWRENDVEKKTSSLTLLAQVHTGFTKRIHDQATSPEPYLAWIDGPYGKPPDYGKYESVILVASGIGVTAHILAIKDLLEDHKQGLTRTKSVSLYWQIDQECKRLVTKA